MVKHGKKVRGRLLTIREAKKKGHNTPKKVSEYTGIPLDLVRSYTSQDFVRLEKEERTERKSVQEEVVLVKIEEAREEEIYTRKGIARYVGISDVRLDSLEKGHELDLPEIKRRGKFVTHKTIIDDMILEGEAFENIGPKVGLTRERIRQYAVLEGLYDLWKEAKKEKREFERTTKQSLVDMVLKQTIDKADETDDRDAILYYLGKIYSKKRSTIEFEKLKKLFRTYDEAQKTVPLSYRHLAKISGMGVGNNGAVTVRSILRKSGKTSLKWSIVKRRSSEERGEIAGLIKKLDYFSYKDIGYFLDIYPATITMISENFGMEREPKLKSKTEIIRKKFGESVQSLSYRGASQIYGFKDMFGSSTEEIADAIEKSEELVVYALKHRKKVESKLIKGLKILFPNVEITRGYR